MFRLRQTIAMSTANPDLFSSKRSEHVLTRNHKSRNGRKSCQIVSSQHTDSLENRIIFMSMFNDIGWTKKGNTETCLHKAKEVAAFATQSKPGHQ